MTPDKKPGLRVLIHQLIKSKRGIKVHSGDIEQFGILQGYKASNADRRARELVEPTRKVKGKEESNPYFCPDIKSGKENGCAVYWYEEPQNQNPVSNYRCTFPGCPKTTVTYLNFKPVCKTHNVIKAAPQVSSSLGI